MIGFPCVIQKCPPNQDLCTELDIVFLFLNSEIPAYPAYRQAGGRQAHSAFEWANFFMDDLNPF